mmetsp:Transcript_25328/g.50554  ORF Transcript_25328/g.50554 Transcript_25328/m.50554 type:complete len:86 (+) Transcript_25328:2626-2883(+)
MRITFSSKAKNPRTIVTTVGTSNAANRRLNDKSTNGKSFKGGITNAIGSFMVDNGTRIACPPGFGIGTENNKCEMCLSKGMSDEF